MPKDIQHTSALFLLGLLTAPLLLIIVLQGLQFYMQCGAEERLEKEALVHLTLPAGELTWVEPGKEAMVEGRLMDIKTIRYEAGLAFVTGIFDEEEEDLLRLLQRQGSSSQDDQDLAQLLGWLQQFVASGNSLSYFFMSPAGKTYSSLVATRYTSPVLALSSPPPQG